jgi:hypothetical protein
VGIFKREGRFDGASQTGDPVDLGLLLLQGQDMIDQLARAHASWGLGSAQRWGLDQRTGTITWTFPDKVATAAAQIIGSYNRSTASWLWAWANESVLPQMSRDARAIRDWADKHAQPSLTQPKVHADEEMAATLAALAVRITRATGFYRGAGSAVTPVITFGPVTLTGTDGAISTFQIDVG